MKSISFKCQEGSSNKEYHIQMVEQGSGFIINFQYGAIGQTLKPGTKTPTPVSEVEAEKIYQSMIKERLKKGYTQEGTVKSQFDWTTPVETKTYGIFPQLLNTIEDDEVQKYINDDRYVAQEKKDGQRRMAVSGKGNGLSDDEIQVRVVGLNKKGIMVQLPELIINSFWEAYSVDGKKRTRIDCCTVDGEIIGEKLFVFDILSSNGKDLTKLPCDLRLQILNKIQFNRGYNGVEIVKTAFTREEKQKMYDDLKAANAEGIVFKLKISSYVAGRPNSGGDQLKNKFQKEASFIVKNLTEGKRSVGLELINEKGERVPMGKCTIPPNKDIPEVGAVVEVRYLYAYKGGAIFQPCYKEQRVDVYPEECLMTQIKYKAGQEVEEED